MSVIQIKRSGPKVRGALRAAHDGIDQAIADGAELISVAMRMRIEKQVDGAVGHAQLIKMVAGLGQLTNARETYIDVHEELRQLGVGLGVVAEGDLAPKGMSVEPPIALAAG